MSENDVEEPSLNTLDCIDKSRDSVLDKMYVSNVGNRLREMETPSDIDCQRWPWELMQNAKDSISGSERNSVEIILEINDDLVIFQHDGCPFNGKTYLALLYKYSEGKANNTESTGRFGTGFLTTHSLSKIVQMEGPIIDEDGTLCGFEVTMYRDGKDNDELIEGMRKMEKEKKFWRNKNPRWTKFKYLLKTKRNKESSELGAMNFQNNIILTMLFNQKFKKVTLIYKKDINLIYEKIQEKQEDGKNNVEIISYTLQDIHTSEKKIKSYLHSKLYEYSKELTEHYNKERYLLVECALEIDPEKKEILCDEKSPCLFCSLPLVGSEKHILPIILNSNDFEPSTERQEILLDGADIKKDEKRNVDIPSDVGINKYILKRTYILFENIVKYCSDNKFNNLHLLTRGLKYIPKVNRYFDKKWYEDNYMKDMRNILLKYKIIYNTNNELSYINDIYFPIYDQYNDENYIKTFYYLIKVLFINVPRYEESIQWSKYLWEQGLEKNRININVLITKYNESKHDMEFNNCFIKFIWDYYKNLTFENKILINQENNYIIYNEKEFAQNINVSEDMINCIEELGNKWRINHLNNNITSVELPIKHDIDYASNIIKKTIENFKEKSFIITRYIEKHNIKRETIYDLAKLLFKNKIGEKYIVENFKEDIWKISDDFIIEKMISIAQKWRHFTNIDLNVENFNKLLNFLYEKNNKIFDEVKLLPSLNGDFNFVKDLKIEIDINEEIKNAAKKHINIQYDSKILNNNIKINNLNISRYSMDDLLKEINQYLNNKYISDDGKIGLCKILINYIPILESNETNNKILRDHNDVRFIYSSIFNLLLKKELIQTQINSIWASIDKYIMIETQKKLNEDGEIGLDSIDFYSDLLNKYQSKFDFEKYNLIPNINGKFLNIKLIIDSTDIPYEILNIIKKIFFKDLISRSAYKGININRINKISINDLGNILEELFEEKKKNLSFNYRETYEICKVIIKYIPKKNKIKENQLKIYNLYTLFDKNIGKYIEIDSSENLYYDINKGIIQFINEKISEIKNLSNTTIDIFELINNNQDILDPYNYAIIPNQLGDLKKLTDLKTDDNIFEELKNILSHYKNIRDELMDKRIIKFTPISKLNNNDLKKEIDKLIEKDKFDIRYTLALIPKNEGEEKQKQKDLKIIYDNIINDKKILDNIEIDLDSSFWEKTNKYCLKKLFDYFTNNKETKKLKSLTLFDIDENEDKALSILETIYKYIPPELNINQNLRFIPNQYGKLLSYNELSEEKELNQNFKDMLKQLFKYDISSYLKHKNLKYVINKQLTINEEITNIIIKGFKPESKDLKEKSKEFIKFYPKVEEGEDNYVLKFIDCYKGLSNEKFEEQQINTNNKSIWDKAIQILLNDILDIIDSDKELKKTSERISLNEDKTIEKLNIFYSILFKFDKEKIINDKCFIPNEKGIYKKIKEIYINLDIDNEIKEVLSLLNEKKSYDHILIHHKIKLNIEHNQKTLEDIAFTIDKEIKNIYDRIDLKNKDNKIEENISKSCKLLIQEWFKNHRDKIELFDFISNHLVDISVKILFDEETKKILNDLLIDDPNSVIEMIKFQGPNAPFLYEESFILPEEESSFDATRDDSMNQNQINLNIMNQINNMANNNNNNNIINNNNNNINNNNNHINNNHNNNNNYAYYYHRQRRVHHRARNNNNYNYNYIDWARIRIEEGLKKYCLAQAIIYEKLVESNIFNEIVWINKLNDNEEGELIILGNGHRYKVKKSVSDYEFKVKINPNKEYKIKVKKGENLNNSLKYEFNNSEWNLFKNDTQSMIYAFVNLKNENNPDIIFSKAIKLNEL